MAFRAEIDLMIKKNFQHRNVVSLIGKLKHSAATNDNIKKEKKEEGKRNESRTEEKAGGGGGGFDVQEGEEEGVF
jgi:hypothetical protein